MWKGLIHKSWNCYREEPGEDLDLPLLPPISPAGVLHGPDQTAHQWAREPVGMVHVGPCESPAAQSRVERVEKRSGGANGQSVGCSLNLGVDTQKWEIATLQGFHMGKTGHCM